MRIAISPRQSGPRPRRANHAPRVNRRSSPPGSVGRGARSSDRGDADTTDGRHAALVPTGKERTVPLLTTFWETFVLLVIFVPLALVWGFAMVDVFRRDDIGGGL